MASKEDDNKLENKSNVNIEQETNFLKVYKEFEAILQAKTTSFERKVEALIKIWRAVARCNDFSPSVQNIVEIINWAKYHTLNIVLKAKWKKYQEEYEGPLLVEVQNAQAELVKIRSGFAKKFHNLEEVIRDPWEHEVLKDLLNKKDLKITQREIDFFGYETAYLIAVRLQKLCESGCEDLALNLVTAYLKCYELALDKKLNLNATEAHVLFCIDIRIALLYHFENMSDIILTFKRLTLEEGVRLVCRFSKKQVQISKIWTNYIEITFLAAQVFLTAAVTSPISEGGGILTVLVAIWVDFSIKYDQVYRLKLSLCKILKSSIGSEQIYVCCEVLHEKYSPLFRNFVVENYIRALTTDMNNLESQKTDKELLKEIETTKRLACAFTYLARILDRLEVARECVLTAFSLEPTLERLRIIEEFARQSGFSVLDTGQIWECNRHAPARMDDQLTWTCEACGKLRAKSALDLGLSINFALSDALNADALAVAAHLCDDLVVLLSGARYQLFTWHLEWDKLHKLCEMYLNSIENTKNLVTELKFLVIDYSKYTDKMKPAAIDENYGIERGYESYLYDQLDEPAPKAVPVQIPIQSIKSDTETLKLLRNFRRSRSRFNSEVSSTDTSSTLVTSFDKLLQQNDSDFVRESLNNLQNVSDPLSKTEYTIEQLTNLQHVSDHHLDKTEYTIEQLTNLQHISDPLNKSKYIIEQLTNLQNVSKSELSESEASSNDSFVTVIDKEALSFDDNVCKGRKPKEGGEGEKIQAIPGSGGNYTNYIEVELTQPLREQTTSESSEASCHYWTAPQGAATEQKPAESGDNQSIYASIVTDDQNVWVGSYEQISAEPASEDQIHDPDSILQVELVKPEDMEKIVKARAESVITEVIGSVNVDNNSVKSIDLDADLDAGIKTKKRVRKYPSSISSSAPSDEDCFYDADNMEAVSETGSAASGLMSLSDRLESFVSDADDEAEGDTDVKEQGMPFETFLQRLRKQQEIQSTPKANAKHEKPIVKNQVDLISTTKSEIKISDVASSIQRNGEKNKTIKNDSLIKDEKELPDSTSTKIVQRQSPKNLLSNISSSSKELKVVKLEQKSDKKCENNEKLKFGADNRVPNASSHFSSPRSCDIGRWPKCNPKTAADYLIDTKNAEQTIVSIMNGDDDVKSEVSHDSDCDNPAGWILRYCDVPNNKNEKQVKDSPEAHPTIDETITQNDDVLDSSDPISLSWDSGDSGDSVDKSKKGIRERPQIVFNGKVYVLNDDQLNYVKNGRINSFSRWLHEAQQRQTDLDLYTFFPAPLEIALSNHDLNNRNFSNNDSDMDLTPDKFPNFCDKDNAATLTNAANRESDENVIFEQSRSNDSDITEYNINFHNIEPKFTGNLVSTPIDISCQKCHVPFPIIKCNAQPDESNKKQKNRDNFHIKETINNKVKSAITNHDLKFNGNVSNELHNSNNPGSPVQNENSSKNANCCNLPPERCSRSRQIRLNNSCKKPKPDKKSKKPKKPITKINLHKSLVQIASEEIAKRKRMLNLSYRALRVCVTRLPNLTREQFRHYKAPPERPHHLSWRDTAKLEPCIFLPDHPIDKEFIERFMSPYVVLRDIVATSKRCAWSVLSNVPGLNTYEMVRPAIVDQVVNVVQVSGGRQASNSAPTVVQANPTSTQISPHIQRIGQPRADKPDTTTLNPETSTSQTPAPIQTQTKPPAQQPQPSTLINILSQQIIRPGQSNCIRNRTTPLINILSQQIIRPANVMQTVKTNQQQQQQQQQQETVTLQKEQTENKSSTSVTTTTVTKSVPNPSQQQSGTILQFICKSSLPKFQQAFGKTIYQNSESGAEATSAEADKKPAPKVVTTTTTATTAPALNIQPIQGGVIYTRQMPVGQTINLIPPGGRGQVFRIATSNADQISLVKDTVIHSKMSALLAAALQGKQKPEPEAGARLVSKPVLQIPANVIRASPQAPASLSSTTLEQLREFDMVYKQVKERSATAPATEAGEGEPPSPAPPQRISVTYVNQAGQKYAQLAPVVVVSSSYCSLQPAASPALSVTSQGSSSPCVTPAPAQPKVAAKGSKGKTGKGAAATTQASKASPIPKPQQKPQEDEHTTQRIFDILAEYAEQLRNSPDLNNKPAPRRRSNPPTNPSQNSKRKKGSGSKKGGQGGSMTSEADMEDHRTVGSEDSSCGIVQLSMQDDDQHQMQTNESNDSTSGSVVCSNGTSSTTVAVTATSTTRQQLILTDTQTNQTRNLIITDSSMGEALKIPNTAVLVPGNYIMPVSMVKGGQQIAVVSGGSKILATVPARSGPNMLLFQSFLNQNRGKSGQVMPTVKYSTIQPISGISSQTLAGVSGQPPVILPSNNLTAVTLGQPITLKKLDEGNERVNTELLLTITQARDGNGVVSTSTSSAVVQTADSTNSISSTDEIVDGKKFEFETKTTPIATPVIATISKDTENHDSGNSLTNNISKGDIGKNDRVQSVLVTACTSNGPMLSETPPRYRKPSESSTNEVSSKEFLHNGEKQNNNDQKAYPSTVTYFHNKSKKANPVRLDREIQQLCLQRKQAAIERELRLQKSLSEECEDLGVDEPSTSDLFPEADILFDSNHSPSFDQSSQDATTKARAAPDPKPAAAAPATTLFSDDDNSGSLRADFLFESVEYRHGGALEYGATNGNESASSSEDHTLLRNCPSMSDVTLNSPVDFAERSTPPPTLNKYKFKYTNRRKKHRVVAAPAGARLGICAPSLACDNWQTNPESGEVEVSSSEDTTSSEACPNRHRACDEAGEYRVVRVALASRADAEEEEEGGACDEVAHCDGAGCSPSGRGARRSVKKTCSCCNGAPPPDGGASPAGKKRPAPAPHAPAAHKKILLNKKR